MNASEYVSLMEQRLTASFDFKQPPSDELSSLAVWAEHNRTSQKYFLAKSVSLYTINNDEYVGLEVFPDGIREEDIQTCLNRFKRLIDRLPADESHMSSIFTAALISEKEIPVEVIGKLEKTKYHKDFWFTLRGWADLAIILIDLSKGEIYSNPFGKKIKKNFVLS